MYPQPYIDYLVHFHGDRDYFECHEVLEEYWKEDDKDSRKNYWVAFIQIAVSLYHQRRNNFNGAFKMMKNALAILTHEENAVNRLGLDYNQLLLTVEKRLKEIENNQPYTSIFLPITDKNLVQECEKECQLRGIQWGKVSDLQNHYLLNKHSLRNRDEVIEERLRQKELKKQRGKNS